MEELINQVSAIVRGMWKFRWQGILAAWIVAAIGVIVVLRVPDRYEASARVFVDTQSILKPLMSGLAVQPNVEQQVVMLSRTLISRPNLEKLVRMADLDLKNNAKAQQEATIEELTKTLAIQSAGRDNLYTLSFRDPDPQKAQRVIQSLVSIFVESSLGASRKDTASAKVFLDDQIKGYETKLEEAEARLKQFRIKNLALQSADGKDSTARLAEMSNQLDAARLELREAENARDAAKAQLATERNQNADVLTKSLLQESALSVSTPEIDARIEAQKRNLDGLLQRYTEQHPEVASTRRLIKDLEDQKKKEIQDLRRSAVASATGTGTAPGQSNSLAAQEMNRVMAMAEVQVASLRARVSEYSARYSQALSILKSSPQIEAEAAQLNRDYAIHKKNYEDLVSRREAATMSGELESASGVADFRLIDPPRVSPKPVSPNRLLLFPLALVAALAAGSFVAFAMSQLRPVFFSANDLRIKTELPLLGVVTKVMTDAAKRKQRGSLLRFCIATGSLVVVFAAGMIVMTILTRNVGASI